MAHIERRVRNGKTTYRARYRDPAGREHAKVFARKADAQRFLTEVENHKAQGHLDRPGLGAGAVPRLAGGVVGDHHQPAADDPGAE